jgi:hypothetical protein
MEKRRRRNSSPFGALLLVFIGVILLLNVLGALDWNIWWSLIRLWPILLISAGLDLLLGRTRVGSLLAAILLVALATGALWLMSTGAASGGLVTQEIRQPLGDATSAEVSIEPVVGTLRVQAAPESASLVDGAVRLGKNEEIQQELTRQGEVATFTLSAEGDGPNTFPGGLSQTRVWELGLSPGASLALSAKMAVGDIQLDLTGLTMDELSAETGMGRIRVTLPATGRFAAHLSQGLGIVEIVIPEGMAVRIKAGTAMAGRRMPDNLVQEGEFYTSPGYATAANRAEIDAGVAMGLLTVRYQE